MNSLTYFPIKNNLFYFFFYQKRQRKSCSAR